MDTLTTLMSKILDIGTPLHIHIHSTYIYIHSCIHTFMPTYTHTHVYTYIYIYIYIHIYTHTHTHIYIHIYIYIHTYIHTIYVSIHMELSAQVSEPIKINFLIRHRMRSVEYMSNKCQRGVSVGNMFDTRTLQMREVFVLHSLIVYSPAFLCKLLINKPQTRKPAHPISL